MVPSAEVCSSNLCSCRWRRPCKWPAPRCHEALRITLDAIAPPPFFCVFLQRWLHSVAQSAVQKKDHRSSTGKWRCFRFISITWVSRNDMNPAEVPTKNPGLWRDVKQSSIYAAMSPSITIALHSEDNSNWVKVAFNFWASSHHQIPIWSISSPFSSPDAIRLVNSKVLNDLRFTRLVSLSNCCRYYWHLDVDIRADTVRANLLYISVKCMLRQDKSQGTVLHRPVPWSKALENPPPLELASFCWVLLLVDDVINIIALFDALSQKGSHWGII